MTKSTRIVVRYVISVTLSSDVLLVVNHACSHPVLKLKKNSLTCLGNRISPPCSHDYSQATRIQLINSNKMLIKIIGETHIAHRTEIAQRLLRVFEKKDAGE